ncbi:hypothetical protein L7F22_002978 [Adiantum nelumboides]|nr:hypothetical protein [Adiantum nelumboides]
MRRLQLHILVLLHHQHCHVKMKIAQGTSSGSFKVLIAGIVAASISIITFADAKLDKSLIWGTYRPQIYFGIRAAEPESFLSGLVWFSPDRPESIINARHECSESDKIDGYGWTYHDGRSLAVQEIKDTENNYLLETSWIKTDLQGTGTWAVRIKGTIIDPSKPASLSTIYYSALESSSSSIQPTFEQEKTQITGTASMAWKGSDPKRLSSSVKAAYESYGSKSMPYSADLLTLSDSVQPMSNFFALQRSFSGNFSFDIFYDAKDAPKSTLLDGNSLGVALEASKQAYSQHLELTFPVPQSDNVMKGKKATGKTFVRELTSQIVGSIGYYFGSSIVDRSFTYDYDDIAAEPRELILN